MGPDKNELYMGPLEGSEGLLYNGEGFNIAAIRSTIEMSISTSTLLIWKLTKDLGMIDALDCTAWKQENQSASQVSRLVNQMKCISKLNLSIR